MKKHSHKKISILGAGKIGLALASHWCRAGHTVLLGSRDPQKLQPTINELHLNATAISLKEAANKSDIIVLSVPHSAINDLIAKVGTELKNKIIIDATNPFGLSPEGHVISTLPANITEGSYMASLLPDSHVVRTFSHVMDELLMSRGLRQPGLFAMAMAGDNNEVKAIIADLIHDTGFVPVDIGTLVESAPLDPGGVLFPQFFTVADMKRMLKNKYSD